MVRRNTAGEREGVWEEWTTEGRGSGGGMSWHAAGPGFEPKSKLFIKPGTVMHPDNATQETQAAGSDVLGHIQLANSKTAWVT